MLRARAFRQTNNKIVKIQVHPTHPWLVTADDTDHVSVWNWEHRQVIYELKAGGVDERRLVGAKLEKLAEGDSGWLWGAPTLTFTSPTREHSLTPRSIGDKLSRGKIVKFYDDDVRYWQLWRNRSAAAESPSAVDHLTSGFTSPAPSTKGRHFLVICCENKAIFLDLVTMRGRDVPKSELDNRSLVCMEFLTRSSAGDGPLVAFGSTDGVIRVLSMITWKLARRYTAGHKGSIYCLMNFMASSGEALLVSGGSDGLLILWNADQGTDSRDLVPKLSLKAHDGGVVAVELSRVSGSAPQLITIGADKTLAIWDTMTFKELRRIKPVPKLACHSVASWCHPRAPNLDILTCVKDSHIWSIEHPTYSALTRPLCELSSLVPPQVLATHKKLRVFCMVAHPLQPHLVATGTNVGIIVSEFDPRAIPSAAFLPALSGSRENSAVYILGRELKLLNFQISNTANPSLGNNALSESGVSKLDAGEQLTVKQTKKKSVASVPHDSYSVLSVSSSGKYVAVVWPDILYFSIYKVSDWSIVDSGSARILAWDTCRDRFAILESVLPQRIPMIPKGGSSRKAKEAAAAAAQVAAAANAASSASVQVRILLDDGTSNILMRSVGGRSEPVIGLHGGALLGIGYRTSRRISPVSATAISTIQSMPLSGFGNSNVSSFSSYDDGSSQRSTESAPLNYQLYSWENFEPVGGMLPQPEWTAWDKTVEYCAFAYQQYMVISSLRPQYRYLGNVAISHATGAVWHRRQLFVATQTTIECVFVDAGVTEIDIETRKMKEEMKLKEAQARAVAEHGELALITVEGSQSSKQEKISLRAPLLQVVRLASFQNAPSVPPFLSLPRQSRGDGDDMDERRASEVAVGGGGVSVAVTRFPVEQKRPVGPLVVAGVRDGVLWLIDRYQESPSSYLKAILTLAISCHQSLEWYMCAHAISLNHPGIRCRCLAAYGDAISAVKWASRLGREHHDDLAQFMLGMGYATEALHLPGISKRLEFDLAMQSNDLKRALHCLLTMSNSRDIGQDGLGLDLSDILSLTAEKKEDVVEAVEGIVKFAKEFLDLIDAADATGNTNVAREALKRLATAGSVKGALQGHELRGLSLRLANHGELTRLSGLINNLISIGLGRESAFSAAVLGDNALMEKAWQDTGMLAEAVLHAHAHGRPSLKNLVQAWNKTLQKEVEQVSSTKTDAASAFLASLEDPKLTSLSDASKKPPIEILPPGMSSIFASISAPKKPLPTMKTPQPEPTKPLAIEEPAKPRKREAKGSEWGELCRIWCFRASPLQNPVYQSLAQPRLFLVSSAASASSELHPLLSSNPSEIQSQVSNAASSFPLAMCPVMKGGKFGSVGAVTLEKGKLDMTQKKVESSPEIATGGGGGDIGKKINFGGGDGGDDDGDDDDYFDEFDDDDDDGDEGGLFRRRMFLAEIFDRKFVDAVLNEWQKTMLDLPAGLRQAYEMGLVSSAQMVKFLAINARPTTTRLISRALPQGLSRAFVGRMLADPSFLYRLLLEQAATVGCSVWWEVKTRKNRIKEEWDLALINVLTVSACNAAAVWLLAPSRSYGNTFRFDLQNTLQKLPNNIFETSYPLREFDLQKRVHSLFYKAAELSILGVATGAFQGSLSNFLAGKKKNRVSVTVPSVGTNALGYGAFLGLYANLRYQLLCGFERTMSSHFDVIGVALFFGTAVRIMNVQLGEKSRQIWLGVEADPLAQSDDLLAKAYNRPSSEEGVAKEDSRWFISKNAIVSGLLGMKQHDSESSDSPQPPKARRKRIPPTTTSLLSLSSSSESAPEDSPFRESETISSLPLPDDTEATTIVDSKTKLVTKQVFSRKKKADATLNLEEKQDGNKAYGEENSTKLKNDLGGDDSVWLVSSDSEPPSSDPISQKVIILTEEDEDLVILDKEVEPAVKKAPKKKSPKKNSAQEISEDSIVADEVTTDKNTKPSSGSSSKLPLVLSEKVNRTKVLVECEGDSIDLSGDMGAVGRVGTCIIQVLTLEILQLQVNVGQSEAKIEAIMNDFIQLTPVSNVYEAETMVEGTLEGFLFDSKPPDDQSGDTAEVTKGSGKAKAKSENVVGKKRGRPSKEKQQQQQPAKKARSSSAPKKTKPKK
ncbi:hypothetical protein YC2023_113505 [Brassica napus]